MKALRNKLADAVLRYAELEDFPVDQQAAMCEALEEEVRSYENELHDLLSQGEGMIITDPQISLPTEVAALQTHWQKLQQQVGCLYDVETGFF